jgi:nucleolar pre-ribosomal-associated protein 2
MIFGAAFSIFQTRATPLDDMKVITKDDLDTSMATFKDGLLEQLKDILHKSRKDRSNKLKAGQKTERLMVLGIIDALAAVGIDSSRGRREGFLYFSSGYRIANWEATRDLFGRAWTRCH